MRPKVFNTDCWNVGRELMFIAFRADSNYWQNFYSTTTKKINQKVQYFYTLWFKVNSYQTARPLNELTQVLLAWVLPIQVVPPKPGKGSYQTHNFGLVIQLTTHLRDFVLKQLHVFYTLPFGATLTGLTIISIFRTGRIVFIPSRKFIINTRIL